MHRLHLIISGNVQGVFFRDFVQKHAKELGITGWVRNNPDGTVEVIAEGRKEHLEQLLDKCKEGPRAARIDDIQVEWSEGKGEFHNFSIQF